MEIECTLKTTKLSKEVFTPILTFPRQGGRDSSAAFMASLHIYIPLSAHQGRGGFDSPDMRSRERF